MNASVARYDGLKRLFDILISTALILCLLPVLVLTAVGVRLALGSPVLFSQWRPGRAGKLFLMRKFRTMLPVDPTQPAEAQGDDRRLTSVGRLLRATSLDELPELFNVLKGDMSLVGPRPLLPEYLPLYSERQARRHEVRPGITGWAQVNGRNHLNWPDRLEMDVWYVENRSFKLDIRILLMTLVTVLGRKGISQPGSATMQRFDSSEAKDDRS